MRKPLAVLAAAAVAVSSLFAAQPAAQAGPNNLVAIGDSQWANPSTMDWLPTLPTSKTPNYVCALDPDGPAQIAGRKLGLNVADYSCTGNSVFSGTKSLTTQVDRAINDGALNGDTKEVILNVGINDSWAHRLSNVPEQDSINQFVNVAGGQVDRIRAAAPNADIAIVGNPQISDGPTVCLAHFGNNIGTREMLPLINDSENLAQRMNEELARAKGVQFVDMHPASQGHSMCAPDGQRWYVGIIDTVTHANMPVHMSDTGKFAVGNLIADAIAG